MLYRNVLYLIALFCEISCEMLLKIDLDESSDEQTAVNNLYITFINGSDAHGVGNGSQTMDLNAKNNLFGHQLVKRNPDSSPMYIPLDIGVKTDVSRQRNMHIPIVQNRGNSTEIKTHLGDFRMIKRKTFISTPNFDFPFIDSNSKYHQVPYNDHYRRKMVSDDNKMDREVKLFDVLTKQNNLIERIANKLMFMEAKKKKIARTYFDDILESVEQRRSTKKSTSKQTTNTKKPGTVLTVIDETEIRNALKKDPFVSRILRLAGRKKQEYENKKDKKDDFLM